MKENIGGVAEVDSVVNTGAFNNNNPGFVDVNKIENEAKEINVPTAEEPKKFDLAALLQPDTKYSQPAPQPKQDDLKSSIFGFFGKKNEEPVNNVNKESEFKEEKPIYEPLSKENSTFIPLDKFENNNVDDYNLGSNDTKSTTDYKPLDLSTFNISSKFDDFDDDKIEIPDTIQPKPIVEEKPVVEEVNEESHLEKQTDFISSYKPMHEFNFEEPEMPTIDLSQLNNITLGSVSKPSSIDSDLIIGEPNKSEPKEKSVIQSTEVPKPIIEETPVVEEKTESINEVKSTPIIVSDYEKQYDPVLPTNNVEKTTKPSFKDVLFSIRDNVDEIEKAGYYVDTDEIDLGTDYRIIITIKKDGN